MANKRFHEEKLENEAQSLFAHSDYILNQVKAARQLNRWICENDVFIYMRDFFKLHYLGGDFQQIAMNPLRVKIRLSNEAKVDCEDFFQQHRLGVFSKLITTKGSALYL